jgi:transposase
VAVEAVDFPSGSGGLTRLCKQQLEADPFSGSLFVFIHRGRTAIKILAYDQQGFWVCQKRRSRGRFRYWPRATGKSRMVEAHELQLLLVGGNPATAQAAPA